MIQKLCNTKHNKTCQEKKYHYFHEVRLYPGEKSRVPGISPKKISRTTYGQRLRFFIKKLIR